MGAWHKCLRIRLNKRGVVLTQRRFEIPTSKSARKAKFVSSIAEDPEIFWGFAEQ